MRDIDRLTSERYGIPSATLMENAAAAVVRCVSTLLHGDVTDKSIVVFCGKGNNGGDGAAAARLLATSGARVDVILIGRVDETKGDARENFDRLRAWNDERALQEVKTSAASTGSLNLFECESEKGWKQLLAGILSSPHDAIVDALFGTGLTRPVEGIHARAIEYIRDLRHRDSNSTSSAIVVSVDMPSGLNSDSNEIIGETVPADATVTMTAPKLANVLPPASNYNGQVVVAPIGSPRELIESKTDLFLIDEDDARRWLIETRYAPDSYKNSHGHALIVAGSPGFTGAAALCANAAIRAGAGLVTVATPTSSQPLVAAHVMPEVMTTALAETDQGTISVDALYYFSSFAERADVVAIGPGLSSDKPQTPAFVRRIVQDRATTIVVDADGLNSLSPWPHSLRGSEELPIVLTPHPGEMLRLIGSSDKSALDDRVAVARAFATENRVILVLKGTRALVAAPDGRVFVNSTGNAGLGTAGAGDTLTGVITGFLAQAAAYKPRANRNRVTPLETVIAALFVSGLAGDFAAREIGMRCMVASDIREHLSAAIRSLDPAGEKP
jgi:NAD(P)H-hydrate epimerase